MSVSPPRVRLTRGLAGEYISTDGRWRITPAPGGYQLTDSFKRAQFEYRPGTWAIAARNLYTARAFINGYLAGLYRSPADAPPAPANEETAVAEIPVSYEKCAHCHLFVEPNEDAESLPGGPVTIAAHIHLHRGDDADEAIDASHDAEPSGMTGTLAYWKKHGPPEMKARFTGEDPSDG